MKNFFALLFITVALILTSCQSDKRYGFLEGTWVVEIEGRTQYECWEVKDGEWIGHSYELDESGEKIIFENMTITEEGEDVFLNPIVENQNDGREINFKLNPDVTDKLSFENPDHDFPNKIQYKKVTDDQLNVDVLGTEGRGFSMVYNRHLN